MLINDVIESIEQVGTRHKFFLSFWHQLAIINTNHQQFHKTTDIFQFIIMTNFLPEKEHMREALLFCFNLKKSENAQHVLWIKFVFAFYKKHVFYENICLIKTADLSLYTWYIFWISFCFISGFLFLFVPCVWTYYSSGPNPVIGLLTSTEVWIIF